MAVEIIADDNCAVFIDNTSGIAFGPTVCVSGMGAHSHRQVAREVLERCEPGIRKLWDRNPDAVRMHVNDAKTDLFGDIYSR